VPASGGPDGRKPDRPNLCDHALKICDHKPEKHEPLAETSGVCGIVARDMRDFRVIQKQMQTTEGGRFRTALQKM
jgi:hypothetical protein